MLNTEKTIGERPRKQQSFKQILNQIDAAKREYDKAQAAFDKKYKGSEKHPNWFVVPEKFWLNPDNWNEEIQALKPKKDWGPYVFWNIAEVKAFFENNGFYFRKIHGPGRAYPILWAILRHQENEIMSLAEKFFEAKNKYWSQFGPREHTRDDDALSSLNEKITDLHMELFKLVPQNATEARKATNYILQYLKDELNTDYPLPKSLLKGLGNIEKFLANQNT